MQIIKIKGKKYLDVDCGLEFGKPALLRIKKGNK
jgi:hypothetical protein